LRSAREAKSGAGTENNDALLFAADMVTGSMAGDPAKGILAPDLFDP
jgi:hypothetical protein